jgi:hypothetical protein
MNDRKKALLSKIKVPAYRDGGLGRMITPEEREEIKLMQKVKQGTATAEDVKELNYLQKFREASEGVIPEEPIIRDKGRTIGGAGGSSSMSSGTKIEPKIKMDLESPEMRKELARRRIDAGMIDPVFDAPSPGRKKVLQNLSGKAKMIGKGLKKGLKYVPLVGAATTLLTSDDAAAAIDPFGSESIGIDRAVEDPTSPEYKAARERTDERELMDAMLGQDLMGAYKGNE